MRRIGLFMLALCLTVGTIGAIGCGGTEDTTTPPPATGADDADAGDGEATE